MTEVNVQPIGRVPRTFLHRLFDEETHLWTNRLRWSFEPTRRRLEAALSDGALNGLVVMDAIGACAYATYVIDGDRGIVGSTFSSERVRSSGLEEILVRRILERLTAQRLDIIDCQTLFSSAPALRAPFADFGFESAARSYMIIERGAWQPDRHRPTKVHQTKAVHRADLRSVARLIFDSHFDTRPRDASSSFDTLESCERILRQITVDDVCGPFDPFSSRRCEAESGTVSACLVTWPLNGVAHISEVATAPKYRRRGLARLCLVEALNSVFEQNTTTLATLSVTSSNLGAIALYEALGFTPRIQYESHVLRERPL
ncbi:MAG: GNAT family N-acetyltransferase [Vicinamibacteria bacterium]